MSRQISPRENPLSVKDVARHFNVHPKTVRDWFADGLDHYRLGDRVFTSWAALERYARKSTANDFDLEFVGRFGERTEKADFAIVNPDEE